MEKEEIEINGIKYICESSPMPKEGSKEWYEIINKTPKQIRKETEENIIKMINGK